MYGRSSEAVDEYFLEQFHNKYIILKHEKLVKRKFFKNFKGKKNFHLRK